MKENIETLIISYLIWTICNVFKKRTFWFSIEKLWVPQPARLWSLHNNQLTIWVYIIKWNYNSFISLREPPAIDVWTWIPKFIPLILYKINWDFFYSSALVHMASSLNIWTRDIFFLWKGKYKFQAKEKALLRIFLK